MTEQAHPTAVFVPVKPAIHDRRWSPAFSRRLPVVVESEQSPKAVMSYSEFHGVGRDAQHAMPHMWRYQALAIADKLSIAAWPFQLSKIPGALFVPGSRVGGMNPTVERGTVIAPRQESLSSRAAVYPENYYAPQYAKII